MVTAAYVFSTLPALHSDNCGLRQRLTSLCRLPRPHKRLRETQTGLARLMSIFVRNVRSRLSKSRSFCCAIDHCRRAIYTRAYTALWTYSETDPYVIPWIWRLTSHPIKGKTSLYERAGFPDESRSPEFEWHPSFKGETTESILARSYSTGMESQTLRLQAVSLLDLTNSMPTILSESASELRAANVGSFLIHRSPPVTIRVLE